MNTPITPDQEPEILQTQQGDAIKNAPPEEIQKQDIRHTKTFKIQMAILAGAGMLLLFATTLFLTGPDKKNPPTTSPKETIPLTSLPKAPTITQPKRTSYPTYFFLFTHTEDHINHTLSEERYTRVGSILEDLQQTYPTKDIVWTVEFMGADAKTVADRDSITGVATYLKSLAASGLVEFGYHAHHDPTYLNRPQKPLTANSSWQEAYDAMYSWITCEKDPYKGGCVSETGGGILAIEDAFGPVELVTGLGGINMQGTNIERSAGSEAVRSILPDRMLGFGMPDHGSTLKDTTYITARDTLMELLTPTAETTSTVFWMDNAVRINDGVPHEGMNSLRISDGATTMQTELAKLNNTSINFLNASIADKFIYAASGSSPTQWAYAHPTDPELPPDMLNSAPLREKLYANTKEAMDYLLGTYLASNAGGFLNSDAVVAAVTTEDYWEVNEQELSSIAAWLVHSWKTTPPVYTTDGTDFYSLADTFALLWNGLLDKHNDPSLISSWYGPWAHPTTTSKATEIASTDLLNLLETTSLDREIPATFTIGDTKYSAAQILYAMAYEYLSQANTALSGTWTHISIPALSPMPQSFEALEDIGCIDCTDTAWSLKPARFHE